MKNGIKVRLLTWVLAGGLTALLVACGGGGGTTASPTAQAKMAASADPVGEERPAPAQELAALRSGLATGPGFRPRLPVHSAARFLSQASFGATDESVETVRQRWRQGWLFQQTALPHPLPGVAGHFDRVLAEQERWVAAEPGRERSKAPTTIADAVIWQSYITAEDQLRKRVGYSLSQMLVTSLEGLSSGRGANALLAAGYLDTLEAHAFGNYRDLLEAVSLNPAMGQYLSIRGSRAADGTGRVPDENYAREIMQLFTIGLVELRTNGEPVLDNKGVPKPSYSQSDVTALAQVFTGWDIDHSAGDPQKYRTPMKVRSEWASKEKIRVLGKDFDLGSHTPQEGLDWALDTLFQHPNVGPFIGRQLIQRLVTSHPSPDYVARVAARFNDNGQGVRGDLGAVIEAVLLDPEALLAEYAPRADWGKLREPVLRLTQLARHLRMRSADSLWPLNDESDPATGLGQSPMRSPTVFNFYRPGYVPPGTPMADAGHTAPEFQITSQTSVPGFVNRVHRFLDTPEPGVTLDYSREMALADRPPMLVARINDYFAHGTLSAGTRARMEAVVSAIPLVGPTDGRLQRAQAALLMAMASPQTLTLK